MNNLDQTLEMWAGAKRKLLALVFTDIVDSTAIGQKLGDNRWIDELANHFNRGRNLVSRYDGFVVKVIGDAFFVAFHNSTQAVDFAVEFSKDAGVDFIGIRIGIHSGEIQIVDNDIYGLNVNQTARIQSSIEKEGISVSDSIKEDVQNAHGDSMTLKFRPSPSILKNFRNKKIWRIQGPALNDSYRNINRARNKILRVDAKDQIKLSNQSIQTANSPLQSERLTDVLKIPAPDFRSQSERITDAPKTPARDFPSLFGFKNLKKG